MSNERFTELPVASSANFSDIICAVQGYISPSVLGVSVQESLQQVYNLFQQTIILSYAGNPNGVVAGTRYQFLWDTVDGDLYICTVSGTASTAVWTLIADTPPSGLVWNTISAATITMISNSGYIVNYGGGSSVLTLPVTSVVGDELIIMGLSASGYSIAQAAGQQIIIAPDTTTLGASGSITATSRYCAITLRCMVADTIWGVSSGPQDAFTIV